MTQYLVRSTGAWDRFRDDVRTGLRTTDEPMDALYHAAWCDAWGLERLSQGELHLAAMWFEESASYLLRSVAQEAA